MDKGHHRRLVYNKKMNHNHVRYADDDVTPVKRLAEMRIPSLALGLLLGLVLSFATSRFEEVLLADVKLVFFIPLVVYMAAAVGAQTQSIYVRDLKTGKANFKTYLFKETLLGILLAAVSSIMIASVVLFWFGSVVLMLAVALSMFAAVVVAPLVALLVSEILALEHADPAVGSAPISTVIQDTLSVVIYGVVASYIIL